MKFSINDAVRLNNNEIGTPHSVFTVVATKETKDIIGLPAVGFDYIIQDVKNGHLLMVLEDDIY